MFEENLFPQRSNNNINNKRFEFLTELESAKQRLPNFSVEIRVKDSLPTYGSIQFFHQDLSDYDSLKKYAGEYGFVVPIRGGKNKKVLKGEKMLKYK